MDGTWNDETGAALDGLVTNIVNLQRMLTDDNEHQIVRYHRGVGNDDDNSFFGNIWGGATGSGVKKIVERAYVRFVKDWQNGDEVFIFGFSRGAAAARMLAKKIEEDGIPSSIKIWIKPKENKTTKVVEQLIDKWEVPSAKKEPRHKVNVFFLGVWDTVSAFGLYNNIKRFFGLKRRDLFTNHHIAGNIQKAVHLVAIDETRLPFIPSLMNHKDNVTHEVWFPGVHSDIGGSYEEDEIAKVSMHYMLKIMKQWILEKGMPPINFDEENLDIHSSDCMDEARFHFHGISLGEDLRQIRVQVDGKPSDMKPLIHTSYKRFCWSHATYSVIETKEGRREIRFQYMPFNVKELKKHYTVVD